MAETVANQCLPCNTQAENDEPEMLIIHTPRIQQHATWGQWAMEAADFLKAHGWRVNRIGPDVHAMHPLMVQ